MTTRHWDDKKTPRKRRLGTRGHTVVGDHDVARARALPTIGAYACCRNTRRRRWVSRRFTSHAKFSPWWDNDAPEPSIAITPKSWTTRTWTKPTSTAWPARRPRPTWTTRPWDTAIWPRAARWRTQRTGSVPRRRPWPPPGRTTRLWATICRRPRPRRLSRPATGTTPAALTPLPPPLQRPRPLRPPQLADTTTVTTTRTIIRAGPPCSPRQWTCPVSNDSFQFYRVRLRIVHSLGTFGPFGPFPLNPGLGFHHSSSKLVLIAVFIIKAVY